MSFTVEFTDKVPEKGTAVFVATFTDESGAAATPNTGTLTWTLTDRKGGIINTRSAVPITSAATVYAVLTGLDNAITASGTEHYILFEWLYNSTRGTNLPGKLEGKFSIFDFVAVS